MCRDLHPRPLLLRPVQPRSGFTLLELLVVIAIILVVSVLGLAVYRGSGGRQINEASRLVQAEFAGARDVATRTGRPAGIRLLPDPALTTRLPNGQIDPKAILAVNRMVPIAAAPNYSEGNILSVRYDVGSTGYATYYPNALRTVNGYPGCPCLVLEQAVLDPSTGLPNPPTNWFWNVRVGDQIQIGGSGPWYTIVGPMVIGPAGVKINGKSYANAEMFVNVGLPGTAGPNLSQDVPQEYLLLVNGRDDNGNGWIDEGFDGIDNDADGIVDDGYVSIAKPGEWEVETWPGR